MSYLQGEAKKLQKQCSDIVYLFQNAFDLDAQPETQVEMSQPVTTFSLETFQWMVTAGKGDGFMYHFGPSTMKTLVPPRREEHHHELNRGRNNILSLPRQRAYIAWTKVETICTIGDGSVQSSEED